MLYKWPTKTTRPLNYCAKSSFNDISRIWHSWYYSGRALRGNKQCCPTLTAWGSRSHYSSACLDSLATASLAFREPKHVLRVMSVSAIGNTAWADFLSSPGTVIYLSPRSANGILRIRHIKTLLPFAWLLPQTMHMFPGILAICSRHMWRLWRLHSSSFLHSMYRKSGNFRVTNFRVLNFRVKIFSWVDPPHENIFNVENLWTCKRGYTVSVSF